MPRSEPVPTEPEPPIWKTDLGVIPLTRAARSASGMWLRILQSMSVARSMRCRFSPENCGGRLCGLPQKRGSCSGSSAVRRSSQRAPWDLATSFQKSGSVFMPSSPLTNHSGKEKQKSKPTTIRGVSRASSISHGAISSRVRPPSRRTVPARVVSAAALAGLARVRAGEKAEEVQMPAQM